MFQLPPVKFKAEDFLLTPFPKPWDYVRTMGSKSEKKNVALWCVASILWTWPSQVISLNLCFLTYKTRWWYCLRKELNIPHRKTNKLEMFAPSIVSLETKIHTSQALLKGRLEYILSTPVHHLHSYSPDIIDCSISIIIPANAPATFCRKLFLSTGVLKTLQTFCIIFTAQSMQ